MKQKEKDQLEEMYDRYNYQCFNPLCDNRASQRAHILGNTKLNRRLYGSDVIDDPLNWLPVCGLECNKMMDIGMIPSNQKMIVDIIKGGNSTELKHILIEGYFYGHLK